MASSNIFSFSLFSLIVFSNSTLLITGGTGSFGSKLLTKSSQFNFKEVRILSRDEKKQDDLRRQIKDINVKFFIGDVRDPSSLDLPFKGVDYVFHAAALKQVPSCEFFPMEAVKTNIQAQIMLFVLAYQMM